MFESMPLWILITLVVYVIGYVVTVVIMWGIDVLYFDGDTPMPQPRAQCSRMEWIFGVIITPLAWPIAIPIILYAAVRYLVGGPTYDKRSRTRHHPR